MIGGASDRPVAAILRVRSGIAVCWYNRRLVHAHVLELTELWARRAAIRGWLVAVMTADALEPLR